MISVKEMINEANIENNEHKVLGWNHEMIKTAASLALNETECLLSMDCLDGVDGWEINADGIISHGKMY